MATGAGATVEGSLGLGKASGKNSLASDQVLLPGQTTPWGCRMGRQSPGVLHVLVFMLGEEETRLLTPNLDFSTDVGRSLEA